MQHVPTIKINESSCQISTVFFYARILFYFVDLRKSIMKNFFIATIEIFKKKLIVLIIFIW